MAHEAMKAEETRQGQIMERLVQLEQAIEKLTHTVGTIEDRLKSVLRTREEDESAVKGPPQEQPVPLAEIIDSRIYDVRLQTERLSRILERLEL